MELMNKIYQMATREGREVFYLALVDGDRQVLGAARSVATLKALVSGGRISAASQVVDAAHWVSTLQALYRPDDVVVCQAEQRVSSGFLRTLPVSDFVCERFQAQVRTISGFYHPERVQIGQWLKQSVYWAGLLAIITAFFMLEVNLDQGVHGAARTVLLITLLITALGVGVFWNKISSQ
jgi:hypothetical protein